MEQRYNIHFNRKEPSREQLKGLQDFDAVLKAYEAGTPISRPTTKVTAMRTRYRYLSYAIGSAAAVALLVFAWGQWNSGVAAYSPQDTATYFTNRPFILPPATANVPDVEAVTIADEEQAQTIHLDDGTLVFARSTLFHDRGRAIEQPFQIHYRQLDEVIDYFLAGIPLSYLVGEQQQQLDAAVVLEVAATSAGSIIPIAAGQAVSVQLATEVYITDNIADYALYQLDTVLRQWEKVGPVSSQFEASQWPASWESVQQYQRVVADYAKRMEVLKATNPSLPPRPQAPKRVVANNPTIELDFLNGLALAAGSDVHPQDLERLNSRGIWELLPETGQIDMRAFNVVWEQVRLRRLAGGDRYELTLINPGKEETLLIQPILLDEGNYQAALARYELALEQYVYALTASQENVAEDSASLVAERAQALLAAEQAIQAQLAQLPTAEQQKYHHRKAFFTFEIASWGMYAVARTLDDLPPAIPVAYLDEEKIAVKDQLVYVADPRYKTLYRSVRQPQNQVLPLGESSKIWSVDAQGQLSIGLASDEGSSKKMRFQKVGALASSAALVKQQLSID